VAPLIHLAMEAAVQCMSSPASWATRLIVSAMEAYVRPVSAMLAASAGLRIGVVRGRGIASPGSGSRSSQDAGARETKQYKENEAKP
jgi:hypothetical protein